MGLCSFRDGSPDPQETKSPWRVESRVIHVETCGRQRYGMWDIWRVDRCVCGEIEYGLQKDKLINYKKKYSDDNKK